MEVRAPGPGALRPGPPGVPWPGATLTCVRVPRGLRGVWRSQRLLSTPVQELTPADAGGGVDRAPQDGRQDTRAGPDDVGPSYNAHLKNVKYNQEGPQVSFIKSSSEFVRDSRKAGFGRVAGLT